MNKNVVFIINSIQNQRCIKRVQEFVDNGYGVTVYAFSRTEGYYNNECGFPIEIVGQIDTEMPYSKRLPLLYKIIKNICYKHKDEFFYVFGLDIVMVFYLAKKSQQYIYEESDLVHTYINNGIIRKIFEYIDKWIIKHSLLSVFTSEGFIKYHFFNSKPSNCYVIENRLSPQILNHKLVNKDIDRELSIGFVGKLRYESVKSFAYAYCKNFPKYQFHFYGSAESDFETKMFETLKAFTNCHFHGPFKNPSDLPKIYSTIDLVLSTYDVDCENVRYAEPNKLYESIYFETPIIVSSGTFLSEKVERLGIGYSVNPKDDTEIIDFIKNLSRESINQKTSMAASIDKDTTINSNSSFFRKLKEIGL